MKKTLIMPACLLVMAMAAQAQKHKAPPPPPQGPTVETVKFAPPVIVKDNVIQEFYDRNPSVANIGWTGEHKVVITLKNQQKETYDLSNEAQKKAFEDKYGEAPPTPPAPPPPPVPGAPTAPPPPPPAPPKHAKLS